MYRISLINGNVLFCGKINHSAAMKLWGDFTRIYGFGNVTLIEV